MTGAGVSAASGVPTFRGSEGLWRSFRPEDLAAPDAFEQDPTLVWDWYGWRRELFLTVGTSAVVYPAAGFARDAHARGAFTAEINLDETPASSVVDLSIRGRAEDVLPRLNDILVRS